MIQMGKSLVFVTKVSYQKPQKFIETLSLFCLVFLYAFVTVSKFNGEI